MPRKHASKALPPPSQAPLAAAELCDAVEANVWEADPATLQRRFVSGYAERLLGYPRRRWLEEPDFWRGLVSPGDRARVLDEIASALPARDVFTLEYGIAAADGRLVRVRDAVRVLRHASGAPRSLVGAMTDVTELHRAQEALRASEERLRLLIESAKDYAIFTMDLKGIVTSWNAGARNLTGFEEREILGKSGRVLFTPEDNEHADAEHEMSRALSAGRSLNERWHMHKSGRRFWASGLMMPLRDASGRAVGLVKIMRDTTEQMRLFERLRMMNAELEMRVADRTKELETSNRELESFSYTISHDLQAPLRKIDGYSRVLLEDSGAALDETGRQRLEKIRAASGQMARMIDDLLNLARVTRGQMTREPVDLGALALEVIRDLGSAERGRKPRFSIAPGLRATGDPRLLRIALFNLLDNAWKFTARAAEPSIEFGALDGDGGVFFVRDNGAGFDMAYAAKLFKEFSRLHEAAEFPGTGVGLATVARIVRRHGGRIWAEGAVGAGATFYFTLSPEGAGKP
jgi:PAS domain S-box-containing protein